MAAFLGGLEVLSSPAQRVLALAYYSIHSAQSGLLLPVLV